jgi:predicted aldo/keto reductase-like oxidoreductase
VAYLGEEIKKLGFGLMRLPMAGDEVDEQKTIEMVDLYMDSGFTYFDTAYMYTDGKSEAMAKTAVVERYPREKFQLATKLPAWFGPKTAEEAQQMFWTSLKRTGAEYFDYYLIHNLGPNRTQTFYDFGIWEFLQKQKEKGLIRHLGFSMHDTADALDKILTKHPEMEFVQLQINYTDWDSPSVQSRLCYEVARKHNKPIIIMEPVRGGALGDGLPDEVKAVFDAHGSGMSYASWALRYAVSLDGIITVLSGMSALEHVKDNISFMKQPLKLSEKEQDVIKKVQEIFRAIPSVPCTSCHYCVKDCPKNVSIPGILDALNREMIYKNPKAAKGTYGWETHFGGKGSDCIECGKCETLCPQDIKIIEYLKEAVAKYE